VEVLRDVTFDVAAGETLALLGRSGAGKSTVLRLVNRLEERTAGEIAVDGRDVREWDVMALRRAVGVVFQVTAMFAGTVAENISYGPRLRGAGRAVCQDVAVECLARVGLEPDLLNRVASALSVGQQQRVAIARALANRPRSLLLDEPTSALDPRAAAEVLDVVRALSHAEGQAVVIVTHIPEHARCAADRVAVMQDGRILRSGLAAEIDLAY
jgi:ABC-type methionine transport system ATPase subunit